MHLTLSSKLSPIWFSGSPGFWNVAPVWPRHRSPRHPLGGLQPRPTNGSRFEAFLEGLQRALKIAVEESASVRRVNPPIELPPLANYTIADAITHIAIHNSHHLGQIITLRQIMVAWPPAEGSWTW